MPVRVTLLCFCLLSLVIIHVVVNYDMIVMAVMLRMMMMSFTVYFFDCYIFFLQPKHIYMRAVHGEQSEMHSSRLGYETMSLYSFVGGGKEMPKLLRSSAEQQLDRQTASSLVIRAIACL